MASADATPVPVSSPAPAAQAQIVLNHGRAPRLVRDGMPVIIRAAKGSFFATVKKGATFAISKQRFSLDELIGVPLGARFEIQHGKLKRAVAVHEDAAEGTCVHIAEC